MALAFRSVSPDAASGMDYEAVTAMANGFGTANDTLDAVATALQAAIAILTASALFGNPGAAAQATYLANILPKVQRLSATCEEFETDLKAAVAERQGIDASTAANIQD